MDVALPFPDEAASVVIVTALDIEKLAVKLALEPGSMTVDGMTYGFIPSGDGRNHNVVVAVLPVTGNSPAAAMSSELLHRFPNATLELFVGIAGGIPSPDDAEKHVRLGDVVVSSSVAEHDFGKLRDGEFEAVTGRMGLPSARHISVCKDLAGDSRAGLRPWDHELESFFSDVLWQRPIDGDVLRDAESKVVEHPSPDPFRADDSPRLHVGLIASGDLVVKDRELRGRLAELGARAVEMEGAGAATAAWILNRPYLVVRGIADYADSNKNDEWHQPAAAAAAAVVRCILMTLSLIHI